MAPRQAVAAAVQDLVAARLARGFVPAGLLLVAGVAQMLTRGLSDTDGLALAAGAVLSAGAMLAHGQRVVQDAFGRPPRLWKALARWGSALPLVYGIYVLGWRGLRELATGEGLAGMGLGIVFAGLGTWVLRSWMRMVEVEQLARLMTVDLEATGREGGDTA